MTDRLLVADRVITGHGSVIDKGAVLVRAGEIAAVGRAAEFGATPSVPTTHYGGCSLLPGLIDTHAHLTLPADRSPYDAVARRSEDELLATAARNTAVHLRAGVTTIRDNGGPQASTLRFRDQARQRPGMPRIFVCGAPVTPTLGHLHWFGNAADGADGVRAAVVKLAGDGADHVKVMASGGGTPGTRQWLPSYDLDVLRALVDEAHRRGLAVAAHCHATSAIERAARAGVDMIEHASFLVPPQPGSTPRQVGAAWSGFHAEFSPAVAELIGTQGCFVGATLQGGLARRDAMYALERDREMPAEERGEAEAAREHVDRKLAVLAALVEAGLRERIVISSDAGPADTEFGRLHAALRAATEVGMTSAQAIEAATDTAARAVGIDKLTGSLQPGKAADILVVNGDPLDDLSSLGQVRDVFANGYRVHREDPLDD